MQAITALIVLQRLEIKNPETQNKLKDLESRIQSMALVHQMLYQSHNLSQVQLDRYIPELTRLIFTGFSVDTKRIGLSIDLAHIAVGIDTAISLGLVINELVVNSIKHGFPPPRTGSIYIKLSRAPDRGILLIVNDDGIGGPKDFDPEVLTSVGMRTLLTISKNQLQGKVTITSQNGFQFQLFFQEPERLKNPGKLDSPPASE
jgi:two-component sensor histidine kinase